MSTLQLKCNRVDPAREEESLIIVNLKVEMQEDAVNHASADVRVF